MPLVNSLGYNNPNLPQIMKDVNTTTIVSSGTSNVTTFLGLTDTPASYTGAGSNCIAVKGDESGLEFVVCGGAAAGDKWVDGGTYIYPNSTYADNVIVNGYIYAADWSNVTITESQITDLAHTINTQKRASGPYLYNDSTTIYLNETLLNITINSLSGDGNASWNQTLGDSLYILQSEEPNLNVNSSDYWDDMNTINATQMEDNGGTLNILESWLTTFLNTFGFLDSDVYINDSELPLENRTISHCSNITGAVSDLCTISGTDTQKGTSGDYLYNDTDTIYFNDTKLSTTYYNTTYVYNKSETNALLNLTNASNFWDNYDTANATQITNSGGVFTILESWLSTIFDNFFGGKTTDDLTEGSTNLYDNRSWNQTLGDERYAPVSVTDTNESIRVNNLVGNCSASEQVFGFNSDGTKVCVADATGGGGNPFDQSLNTTDNVLFNKVNTTTIQTSTDFNITDKEGTPFFSVFADAGANGFLFRISGSGFHLVDGGDILSCEADNEKLETGADGLLTCGVNPAGSGADGNASSICSDHEVLMGQDSPVCVNLNNTIESLDDDTTYTHLSNFTDDLDYSTKNTNSSGFWDDYDTANATQITNSGGVFTILESWLSTIFDNFFGGKTTDDLTEGSTNLYDNRSWNQTLGDERYAVPNSLLNVSYLNATAPFVANQNFTKNITVEESLCIGETQACFSHNGTNLIWSG